MMMLLGAPQSTVPGDLTRVSTTEPIWEIVRYNDQSQSWMVVESGPLIIGITGDAVSTPCAYLPQMGRQVITNHV